MTRPGIANARKKRPPYNHTRDDGPYHPCPTCLALMTAAELRRLAADQLSTEADAGEEIRRLESELQSVGGTLTRLREVARRFLSAVQVGSTLLDSPELRELRAVVEGCSC